jgi:polysaccharide deacetylase 2 family uncharacterized protein YibQ
MNWWRTKPFLIVIAVLAVAAGAAFVASITSKKNETVWVVPVEGITTSLVEAGKTSPSTQPDKSPAAEEEQQIASVIVPGLPKPEEIRPAEGKPRIAIIIDDMGQNASSSKRAIALPPAVTLSFLPYTQHVSDLTAQARAAGHELLLHMPMEPLGREDPGPDALLTKLPPEELHKRAVKALDSFSGYDGVNNHMGSKFTTSREGMDVVLGVLKERKLFFFDSLTSSKSVALAAARVQQVPAAKRDVFLDNNTSLSAVKAQLEKVEQLARKNGQAVGIGHPNVVLLQALEKWIPEAEKKGFEIVPVRELVR